MCQITRSPELVNGERLNEFRTEIGGDRVESTAVDDSSASLDCVVVVSVDHLPHPVHLARQITVVRSGGDACFDEWDPILRVRADRRTNDMRVFGDGVETFRLGCVAEDDRDVIPRRTPVFECCFQFVESTLAATAECERELIWCVLFSEVLGDETASAGCTPDNEIVLPVSVRHRYRLQLAIHGLNCWVKYLGVKP